MQHETCEGHAADANIFKGVAAEQSSPDFQ